MQLPGLRIVQVRRTDVAPDHAGEHHFMQVSTLDALIEQRFDGDFTIEELAAHGNLGIGTLDALDGELVLVDGEFFQMTVDGKVHAVPPERCTPFALVTFFDADATEVLTGTHRRTDVEAAIDRLAGGEDAAIAVRIDGRFPHILARSAVPERVPYRRPFAEAVAANQRTFDLHDVTGTMVGFRFPKTAEGIQIPGYHLHVISEDRTIGGHMLDYETGEVRVSVQRATVLQIELPPGTEPGALGLSAADLAAIHGVEG